MNELALFAGAGGGILGGKLLGWRTVCAVEINDYARRVLMARQDDGCLEPFPIWDDVTTFQGRPWRGIVDVVSGGFPCQPFSAAGAGRGTDDERHLWPAFFRLIEACGPRIVYGEQVASAAVLGSVSSKAKRGGESAIQRAWFDGISDDLEGASYTCGAVDLPAACLNSPHIRQRLWWVAYANGRDANAEREQRGREHGQQPQDDVAGIRLGNATGGGCGEQRNASQPGSCGHVERAGGAGSGGMADADQQHGDGAGLGTSNDGRQLQGANRLQGLWDNFDIIPCRDGKARRIERGTFPLVQGRVKSAAQPLADGLSGGVVPSGDPSLSEVQATAEARQMRLRGYGNAIVPELAAEFIAACREVFL